MKAAAAAQEAILPNLKANKAKKKKMADLDRQIAKLQSQRSAIASELEKDFEVNKPRLAKYAASAKRIQVLKAGKRIQHAEIIMGEVK